MRIVALDDMVEGLSAPCKVGRRTGKTSGFAASGTHASHGFERSSSGGYATARLHTHFARRRMRALRVCERSLEIVGAGIPDPPPIKFHTMSLNAHSYFLDLLKILNIFPKRTHLGSTTTRAGVRPSDVSGDQACLVNR